MKMLTNLLYQLTGKLMKTTSGTLTTSELPYYGMLQELGELSLQYEGMPTSKMQKQLNLLIPLMKKLSGDTKPMYLTPKELLQKLPSLTIKQLCTELLWLS
jgi:hypothetical protein